MFKDSQSGFTLVELLLYIVIASTILLSITALFGILLQARVKNQAISEVEQQGAQVMQIITQSIRNAEDINSPAIGASAALLLLDVIESENDPTVFDLSNNAIRITEGVSDPVILTNSRAQASGLLFSNLSYTGTSGIIKIEFTLSHVNPEGRSEYDWQKAFYGSASLR